MKIVSIISKNTLSKLIRVLMFTVIICFGSKVNAQCTANYTSSVDPANNGGVTFTYTGTWLGMGLSTYYWDFGDGGSSLMSNPGTYTYATSGTYTACVTLTDSSSGCYDIYCSTISVINSTGSASCSASFVVYDSAGYSYFQNTSTGSNLISTWTFGDGNSATSAGDITHSFATSDEYYVCMYISDSSGTCTSYFCDTIDVAISAIMSVSENETTIVALENYPNPFSDNTTINYAINKEANVVISVISLLGNTIAELENGNKTSGEYSTTWNAENVAEGMYLLQLKVNNDISTKKIIVNR